VLFAEAHAHWLLILHAVLGASTVAVTTHLVVWTRRYPRGEISRVSGVRWFAAVGLGLYLVQFLLGNVLYPTYKVRVRTEYFDLGSAVRAEVEARRAAREQADERRRADATHDGRGVGFTGPTPTVAEHGLGGVARLFDIKEHWAALGLPMIAGVFALTFAGLREGRGPAGRLLFVCALGAAACAWIAGLIGLWVTSVRSVG
jgi:hypothetical protein